MNKIIYLSPFQSRPSSDDDESIILVSYALNENPNYINYYAVIYKTSNIVYGTYDFLPRPYFSATNKITLLLSENCEFLSQEKFDRLSILK